MDYANPNPRRKAVDFSAHITPAFSSPGTLPAIWSIMGSPRWYSSKQSPCFAPSPAQPEGMGAEIALPLGFSMSGFP